MSIKKQLSILIIFLNVATHAEEGLVDGFSVLKF